MEYLFQLMSCIHQNKPHQADITIWALELGSALIAADTGMGKTHIGIDVMSIVQRRFEGKCLIVTELGAADVFCNRIRKLEKGREWELRLNMLQIKRSI